jgi:hypothetical protein
MRGLVERGGALVAVVAAVGLLAACGASDGTGSKADPSFDEKVEASDSFTSTTAGAVEKCAKVVVSLGEVPPAGSEQAKVRLPLTMTNKGGATCLLRGFPGARLQARDGDTWDLVRTGDAVNDVRLEPDGSATSYLTFLSEPGESGWDVTSLVVTPPNTADSQTFDWPGGPVLRQDAATHPGTYIGPVGVWGAGGA